MSNEQNTIIEEAKIEAEKYYNMERITRELYSAIKATRDEPGMTLADVANVIKKILKPEEVERLINFLKWEKPNN